MTNLCCFREALPQGAPTSPTISNLVMASFDESMGGWCEERQISYTRYCDDMTFSGEFDPGMVIRKVSAYLEQMGMVLNRKKTRVYTRGSRQEVTGLTVNERVQVPRFYRKKLRQEWYYCKKYGVKEHIKALSRLILPDLWEKYNMFCRLIRKIENFSSTEKKYRKK